MQRHMFDHHQCNVHMYISYIRKLFCPPRDIIITSHIKGVWWQGKEIDIWLTWSLAFLVLQLKRTHWDEMWLDDHLFLGDSISKSIETLNHLCDLYFLSEQWPLFILKPIQVQFVAILFTFVANAPILCPFANANGSHFHFSLYRELNYWKKHMTGIQLLVPFGSWPPKGLAPFTYTIKLWKICGLWPS